MIRTRSKGEIDEKHELHKAKQTKRKTADQFDNSNVSRLFLENS